jgi:hypothetical protein
MPLPYSLRRTKTAIEAEETDVSALRTWAVREIEFEKGRRKRRRLPIPSPKREAKASIPSGLLTEKTEFPSIVKDREL